MPQRTNSLVGYGLTNNPEESLKSALPKLISSYSTSEIPTRFGKGPLSAFDDLSEAEHHQGLMMKSDIVSGEVCLRFQQQGYYPRGDLCNHLHTHALPGTTRSAAGMPLSPGLGMTVGTMTGSASFYARANTSVAGASTSSLVNGTTFPFTVTPHWLQQPHCRIEQLASHAATATADAAATAADREQHCSCQPGQPEATRCGR